MEPLSDARFWAIVAEICWPRQDSDTVKLMLMQTYPPETMEAMDAALYRKTAELARVAAVDWCCDSWDDTRAHIVGLGREVFQHNLDNPDPDEIPPRLYRRFSEMRQVCNLLLNRQWTHAVAAYHQACGPGYADDWPFSAWCGHLIPNLERYRLGKDSCARDGIAAGCFAAASFPPPHP